MPAETLYSSGQAAKQAGISEGSLRNYCQGGRFGALYAESLSAGAAPAAGQPRQFTEQDIVLLRYIRSRTAQGAAHATVAAELQAGALADWQPPEESAAQVRETRQATAQEGDHWDVPPAASQGQSAALALGQQWVDLLNTTLQGAQAREAVLTDRLIAAETRAARAEGQLEAAQAQLAELKAAQGRPFWRRLFGG